MKVDYMYRVYFKEEDQPYVEYVWAKSAQEAVDTIRGNAPNIEIMELSRIVTNWK